MQNLVPSFIFQHFLKKFSNIPDQLGSINTLQTQTKLYTNWLLKKITQKFLFSINYSHPQSSRQLENELVKELNLSHGQTLPALSRGSLVKYFPTAGLYFTSLRKCVSLHA
jgi:hypothetical protein